MAASDPTSQSPLGDDLFAGNHLRIVLVFAVPALLAILVVLRLVQFQLVLHNTQDIESYTDRNLPELDTRGVITDIHGGLLASDVWSFGFVIPRLGAMPPAYRDVVTHLVAGTDRTRRNELNARLRLELDELAARRQAEIDAARNSDREPQPVYAWVLLIDDLPLATGQYLRALQQRGTHAADLWDLHLTGDDGALRRLEALLEDSGPLDASLADSGPGLKEVMDSLGLRSALDGTSPDFDFFRHFQLELQPDRHYAQGALASHVLGLVNADRIGANGIERYYQKFLRGEVNLPRSTEPISVIASDARRYIPSYMGGDLVLTIDRSLQHIVEQELRDAINRYEIRKGGTVIVMDTRTGAILAMANLPDFEPGVPESLDDSTTNLTNLAVTAVYEPGSTFKVLTMAAAIDAEAVRPSDVFFDDGVYRIGERVVFRNSDDRVAGSVTAAEALGLSLNTIMAEIAVEHIGADTFYDYLFDFGLGEVTGIDLAHEFNGSLKDKHPGLPNWNIADLGANSFGQGINLTPIQMINAVNVLANQGDLMQPYVVQHRINGDYVNSFVPTVLRPGVVKPETAATIMEMMVQTVEKEVTAAQVPGFKVAGKTGTAQVPDPDRIGLYSEDEVIASFVGFVPAEEPRITVLVLLYDPNPDTVLGPWGSNNAAPLFSRIARRSLAYLNVPPDCHPSCYGSSGVLSTTAPALPSLLPSGNETDA